MPVQDDAAQLHGQDDGGPPGRVGAGGEEAVFLGQGEEVDRLSHQLVEQLGGFGPVGGDRPRQVADQGRGHGEGCGQESGVGGAVGLDRPALHVPDGGHDVAIARSPHPGQRVEVVEDVGGGDPGCGGDGGQGRFRVGAGGELMEGGVSNSDSGGFFVRHLGALYELWGIVGGGRGR